MPKRSNPWWAKVIFDEFVLHFMNKTDEQIANDIKESIAALLMKNDEGDSFGSKMVRLSLERIKKNSETGFKNKSNGNSGKPNSHQVKAPDQLVYGKMENVFLTQEEFNDIATQVGNINDANRLIDDLSCKMADGSFQSDNHFATLCYWASYRKEKGEPQKAESQMARNFRIANEAMERIARGETPKWRP